MALDRRNWLELLKFVSNFGDFYVSIRAWPWDQWIAVDSNNLLPLKYVLAVNRMISEYYFAWWHLIGGYWRFLIMPACDTAG